MTYLEAFAPAWVAALLDLAGQIPLDDRPSS
jgi:hypothetical protein